MNKRIKQIAGIVLCLFCVCHAAVCAQTQMQVVSIHLNDASLKDVFGAIEKQTTYRFSYRDAVVDDRRDIDISCEATPVDSVLSLALSGRDVEYSIVSARSIVIADRRSATAGNAARQRKTISGTVVDDGGEAVIGANIIEKGTVNGIISDVNGNFSLEVSGNASVLLISFIGYVSQEITVGNQERLRIVLAEDNQALDEVVVVGYGTAKKSDVTGAIASVNERMLKEVPVASVSQSMQGRIAGISILQTSTAPGRGSQIRIRGTRSLSASNDPLLIVDGIPFAGTLNDLSPDDIKSIDILKDASSTAIYGSRGANGVILITTSRGAGFVKPQLSYSGYYGIGRVAKKYEVFNAGEFVRYREISRYQEGSPWLAQEMPYFETGKSYDWQDELYQTAHVTNHDLNFRGGKDFFSGSFGMSYYNETSPIPGQEFTRYSLRGNLDMQMNSWLKVGINTNSSFGLTDGEGIGIGVLAEIVQFSPMVNPYDAQGNIIAQPLAPREDAYSPLLIKNRELWAQERQRFMSSNSVFAEIQFLPELKYRANFGFFYLHDRYGTFYASASPFKDGAPSTASLTHTGMYNYTLENLLYYDKTFADRHKLGATLMYSVEDSYLESTAIDATDMTADYMQYHNLGMANLGVTVNSNAQIYQRRTLLSYMGRLNYTYDNKYMATFTVRSDGSSVLAPGKKWHSYPALSLAWNINREEFMSQADFIEMLKLRAGYGQTSNQAVSPYATLGALAQRRYNFGEDYVYGYYSSSLANRELGWEYSDTWNAGIDFSLWHGRLSGNIDVYLQKTKELLVGQRLPASSGVSGSVMVNVGKTQNRGVELTLRGELFRATRPDGFNWEVSYNLSVNRNKLLQLNSGVTQSEGDGWFVGYPVDVIYDYNKIGIWQLDEADEAARYGNTPGMLKLEDRDGDGKITPDDRAVIHTFEPDAEMGMTHRLSFKHFDFTLVSFAQIGGTLVSSIHRREAYLNTLAGRLNNLKVDYWTPENPTNKYPMPLYSRLNNSYDTTMGYFDASYLRIQTTTLGYTLPRAVLTQRGISELRFYLTCNNVATLFSPYMKEGGVDPQPTGYGAGVRSRQLSVGLSTPPVRQFLVGASIKF
ncbi:MAG: TonB-dependent receptor [Tannerella sp.]|jgi:TonB-linked SusC/RagA family outer membrane protein|nr:TonB-dependent receptor [Tannerella sp.]